MTSLEPATLEKFGEVYKFLQDFSRNNPQNTRDDWQRMFTHNWGKPGEPVGYVLQDSGKVVGFIGTVHSHRIIDGKSEPICNLTSWIVNQEHRQKSIGYFMPVFKMSNYTLTVHSPAQHVASFYKTMGFRQMETALKILYPFPRLGRLFNFNGFKGTTDKNEIEKLLRGVDAQIFRDHRDYRCNHLLIYNRERYCYIVFKRTKGRKIYFSEIHYISDPQLFADNLERVKFHFFKTNLTLFALMQSRLAFNIDIPHTKVSLYKTTAPLYKSSHLRPEQVDNLYSEHILLQL